MIYRDTRIKKVPLQNEHDRETVEILPCTLAVVRNCGTLRTVVGSGISVCLYDKRNRCAGMNHFLFPRILDPQKATCRYGNAALIGLCTLLNHTEMESELVAYIAGGAYCDEFEMEIAVQNIQMAWKFLLSKGIPIYSEFVGGRYQREATFDIENNVFSAKIIQ